MILDSQVYIFCYMKVQDKPKKLLMCVQAFQFQVLLIYSFSERILQPLLFLLVCNNHHMLLFHFVLQVTVLSKVHFFYPLAKLLFQLEGDIFLFQFSIHYHLLGASGKHSFCVKQSYQYKF